MHHAITVQAPKVEAAVAQPLLMTQPQPQRQPQPQPQQATAELQRSGLPPCLDTLHDRSSDDVGA